MGRIRFKPMNNLCVIKVSGEYHEKIKLSNGNELLFASVPSLDRGRHAVVTGTVMGLPDNLIYGIVENSSSMDWKTEVDAQIGDVVYFRFIANSANIVHNVELDGEKYILVNYRNLILSKREITKEKYDKLLDNKIEDDGRYYQVVMLNGYVLVEPLLDEVEENSLGLITNKYIKKDGEYLRKKYNETMAIVRFYGRPNECYRYEEVDENRDIVFDVKEGIKDGVLRRHEIKDGDKIILDKNCNIPFEYELHASFNHKKFYYRIQRKHILTIDNT